MTTAIRVKNLSKRYILSHQRQERYTALRDVIATGAKRFVHKLAHPFAVPENDPTHEEFWALNDISCDIQQGDRVGIIGRNGAGKSTLLKILSRITEPTSGKISIRGRVASLLEVGTGFHPELTGRENIFLNGAILGMSKAEIKMKFDEIVAFAEVQRFLDTPVKRYSSGMYVRLAFAVAAHLEPEILIVDEVLAVGDAQFQKKCLGKMEDIGKEGRTVLFVSHNMAAVTRLCSRGIYLRAGALHQSGQSSDVVAEYLKDSVDLADTKLSERHDRQGSGIAKFCDVKILDTEEHQIDTVLCGQTVTIRLSLFSKAKGIKLSNPTVAIGIDNSSGQRVWHLSNESTGKFIQEIEIEGESINFQIPRMPLVPGTYSMFLFLSSAGNVIDWVQSVKGFRVEAGDFFGSGKLSPPGQGYFLADYSVYIKAPDAKS